MKLQEALKGLICEVASMEDIMHCIKNKKRCIIHYDGKEPGGRGIRQIEPVCLGISKAGNKVLRAWDNEGASHSSFIGKQKLPGWRLFRLDKINTVKPTDETFEEMRPNFNPNGDKSMVSIILLAKF